MKVRAKYKKPIQSLMDLFQGEAWKNDRHYQILIERVQSVNDPRLTANVIRFIDTGRALVNGIMTIEHPIAKGFAVEHAFIALRRRSEHIKYADDDIQKRTFSIVTRKLRDYNIALSEEKKFAKLDAESQHGGEFEFEEPIIDTFNGRTIRIYESDNLQ